MSSLKKAVIQSGVVGFAVIVSLSLWMMIVVPNFEKIPDDYVMNVEYDARTTMVDDVYGEQGESVLQQDILSEKVIAKNGNILTIKSTITGKNIETDEIMFHMENMYNVDATTRTHLDKNDKKFEFSPNVEKKDYDFFHPAVFYDDPMVFKTTDVVNGFDTYVFEVTTKGADTSRAFPQFAPHVIFTDTVSKLWIEPLSGNLIKFEKTWDNYLVEDGKRINTIQVGEKHTTEFTELILAHHAEIAIEKINQNRIIIPFFLIIVTIIVGIAWILATNLRRINQQSKQLQKIDKQKDEFVSMMSHEIKNPLTPILSMCKFLLIEKDGKLNEKQRKRIQVILENSTQINDLLDDLSESKKLDLDQVKLVKSEVNLMEYLENVLEGVRPFTGEKNIKLVLDLDETWKITIDQKRITQVISNLVKNAIDFISENDGIITISAIQSSKGTIISVSDNGIGIPSEKSEIIFDKFTQLDNPLTITHVGTGLGLSVCKGIVEAHGGEIWLDTKHENGAKFSFLIPKP